MTELAKDHTDRRGRQRFNPVALKELRSRMRGSRAFWALSLYLLLLSAVITLVYLSARASGPVSGPDPRAAGKGIFSAVALLQAFAVLFLTPAFTAGAIVGEKERQTYDILRTTSLTARAFVAGKLISAFAFMFLRIAAAIPLQSLAFLLGGLSPIELLISQAMLLVGAVFYSLLGLFFSSLMRSTISATISTIGFVMLSTLGIPFGAVLMMSFLGPLLFTGSTPLILETALLYAGLLLAGTNLPAAMIISEALLMEENAVLFARIGLSGGPAWVISPWAIFLVVHILLSTDLYGLTVRRVRRYSERGA
jgi:ABC-type transport system involved in multi-copper enzyme maturation permease subunit